MVPLPRIWLYNPNLPEGDVIDGLFGGARVYMGLRETRSFPYEVGEELKRRYPFLHVVIDHPSAVGVLPEPPSGVVVEPEVATPVETVIEPEVKSAEVPEDDTVIGEMVTCPECQRVMKNSVGLKIHMNTHKK